VALVVGLLVVGAVTMLKVGAHDRITTGVTWDREIAPIVVARCVTCHSGSTGSPVSLAGYEAARPWARAIRQQVLTRQMPVWRAARGYGEFANDPSLSPFEISLIVAWVDGGAPKSPPARAAGPLVTALLPSLPVISPPARVRESSAPCAERVTPDGVIVGLRPQLGRGGAVRVMATWPGGERRILAWFRDGDPADRTTYWLRTPVEVRRGAAIVTDATPAEPCALALIVR
jgi:hypothetical protein